MPPKRAGGRGFNAPKAFSGQQSLAHAVALHQSGHLEQARAIYEGVLRSQPRSFDALHLAGVAAAQSGEPERAVALIGRAIAFKADHAPAHHHLGLAQAALGRFDAALASYDAAIGLAPEQPRFHNDRGNALADLGRMQEAVQSYDRAIALEPDLAETHYNRGCALAALRRTEEALASYDRALELRSDYAKAWNNRGIAQDALGLHDAALESFARAIAIDAGFADAINNRGHALVALKQYVPAVACFDRVLALRPDHPLARGARLRARLQICDWSGIETEIAQLADRMRRGELAARPFDAQALVDSRELHLAAARAWVRAKCPPKPLLPFPWPYPHDDRIRVGYFSPDFRNHAVSILAAELFERHDRSRFEVFGYSFGPDTRDELRTRVEAAFEHFTDVRELDDRTVVELARRHELDIAVDLAGFTGGARTEIFAMRAAPVQASYLGYLGTMGADYIDYLFADDVIVPEGRERDYTEKIVRLPGYQANDTRRPIADRSFTRAELGLPEAGFVFCSFNDNYKLLPQTFDRWMRILGRVERAVLLLYVDNDTAAENLRRETTLRGVDPARLVFAGRLPAPEYRARYRACDLFLDTAPYNAGTTASDALWAGLPVLTCAGETFASRVAASVVTAAGMPELVAHSAAEYEELAVALAASPNRLAALRRRLAENRMAARLFDIGSHTKSLEAAYAEMLCRSRAGLPPDDIDVEQ